MPRTLTLWAQSHLPEVVVKHLTVVAACLLSFAAGALVRLPNVKAQTTSATPKRTYYEVDYMKSRPGQDTYKLEHDVWGPIHRERVKTGQITSWAMMAPVYAGAKNYDYITVTGFHSLGEMENTNYAAMFEKLWGKDKADATMKQTNNTRDFLGSEIYIVMDSVEPEK